MKKLKPFFVVLLSSLIVLFSLEPASEVPKLEWMLFADKGEHFLAYAALGGAWMLSGSWKKAGFRGLLWCLFLGVAMEVLQPYFGRTRDILDVLADALGALSGLMIVLLLRKLVRRTSGCG